MKRLPHDLLRQFDCDVASIRDRPCPRRRVPRSNVNGIFQVTRGSSALDPGAAINAAVGLVLQIQLQCHHSVRQVLRFGPPHLSYTVDQTTFHRPHRALRIPDRPATASWNCALRALVRKSGSSCRRMRRSLLGVAGGAGEVERSRAPEEERRAHRKHLRFLGMRRGHVDLSALGLAAHVGHQRLQVRIGFVPVLRGVCVALNPCSAVMQVTSRDSTSCTLPVSVK